MYIYIYIFFLIKKRDICLLIERNHIFNKCCGWEQFDIEIFFYDSHFYVFVTKIAFNKENDQNKFY